MKRTVVSDNIESGESLPPLGACGDNWIVAIISRQVTAVADDLTVELDKPEPAPRLEPQERCLLPVKEAAFLLGIGKTKAYDLIALGELPAVRIGSKMLVRRTELEDYMAKLPRSKPTRFIQEGRRNGR